ERLNADLASVYKRRPKGTINTVEALGIMGEVDGHTCVLIDEMIDSGGTICAAAELLKQSGATEIFCTATHGILSGPAVDRLKNSVIERLIITNTLPIPPEKEFDKLEVVSVAGIVADAIL